MRREILVGFLATAVGGAFVSGSASAQTCAPNVPHITGTWTTLPYLMPINPISANVLTNGKVLIVAGSENDAKNSSKKQGEESYRAAVWDPTGTDESSIAVQNLTYDVFCSGTAALPDGRSLVVGGTSDYSFKGDNRASIFDPRTGKFAQSQSMVQGRWYATATTLGDGRVMAMSGLTQTGATSTTVEIYDLANAGTGWRPPTSVPFVPPLYPRLFLLPNGRVFYTAQGSGTGNANAWIFDPASGTWTISAARTRDRSYGSSVILPLLPPDYTPRVMNFGGGNNPASSTTDIIDLSVASPSYTPGPNMSTGRIQMNAVILPNGKVLAEGGSLNNESPNTPGKTADLYDPVTNTFTSAGAAAYSRLYHSVALLLPDATVVSMGSNPGSRGGYQAAIEIYTPSYLFDANDHLITTNRPSITGLSPASGVIGYNAPFSVSYTSTSAIASAVLVRPGSATHAVDMDQRLIGLCGPLPQPPCSGPNSTTLDLTTPSNRNVAPPGYYMLFLLDSAGVPSTAQFIQLTQYSTAPPVGAIAAPSSDVTISAGGAVAFGTTTIASKYSWVFSGGSPATSTAQNPGNVTFPNAGTYQVSLTVIDSSGNSDPSPPTRTITVLPTTPEFSITIGQAAQEVVPGGSAAFTVTVTPQSGFTGTVNLSVDSESGFPAGITSGGFSPTVISGSGSSTLTMNTTTSTIPWALSLTVTGTSGTISHIASTTLLVNLAPPASLTATPGDSLVSLSWPASVGATSYHAKRATASGGPYQTFACLSGTSYTDTGLTNDVSYFYVVSGAFSGNPNAGGESADSDEASATPQASLPSPPTGLAATPSSGQIALAWNPSSGATSYRVKRATVSGGPYVVIATPTATSYTDTGVTSGTTYYYVVSAVNSAGESNDSSEVNATPPVPLPSPPTGLAATPSSGQIALAWNPSSGATSYRVKRATVSGGPYVVIATPTSTSYTDTGVTSGTTYYYVVSAVNSAGESNDSSEVNATPPVPLPSPPTDLAATPSSGQIALAWNPSSGATSYRVKRATVSGGPYVVIATPTATGYTDTGVTSGTTYYYVVSAVNSAGESNNSSEVNATPPVPLPSPAPTVWVEDAVPAGAKLGGDGEGWSWVSSNPAPFSGARAHQSALQSGMHQHYFYNATARLSVAVGDTLFAYVYLDPANPPREVMLHWYDGSWEHRAYWGANLIGWGTDGTVSRRYMGPLPAAGQWVRLEVPASQVGLEGHTLNGMAYTLYDGRATWDYAGKVSTPTVWVDDAVPAGAAVGGDGEGWSWVSSNPAPFSGTLAHQSAPLSGMHQHYFYNATATLSVAVGDTLFAYVYLDPANPPREVMLHWYDGSWEHRAYWGENLIGFGTDGTESRRYMGPLPAAGQWVRLAVPASLVGLEGHTLNGMTYTLYDGRATWDYAGRISTPTPTVWVNDAVPAGAKLGGDGEGWSWVSSNPAPFSGARAHQSALLSGMHQHYFYNATARLSVAVGDTLFAYVYLDPANPPREVMLHWYDGSWEHRAYWGANLIGWGTDGTVSRRYMGPLPAAGQWVRLEVPASQVGLEGHTLNGMAYTLYDGRATWDYAGSTK